MQLFTFAIISCTIIFFIKDETLNFAIIGTHMNAVALVLKYCAGHLEKEERNQGVILSFREKVSRD